MKNPTNTPIKAITTNNNITLIGDIFFLDNKYQHPTTKTAVKKTTTATAAKKAPATKKATAAKKEVLYLNEENAGFKAGDVYQALAAAGKALSLAEIAKAAKITAEDAILGIGWLLKEGKIKNEDNKLVLA